jgi:phosphate butyryltransferase
MMAHAVGLKDITEEFRKALIESGYFDTGPSGDLRALPETRGPKIEDLQSALAAGRDAQTELGRLSDFLHERAVSRILAVEPGVEDPSWFDEIAAILEKLLAAVAGFKREQGFVTLYGELLSLYVMALLRCGRAGRDSPLIGMILSNRSRYKAIELSQAQADQLLEQLGQKVAIAIITKRYATYILITRGLQILFRGQIDYRTFSKSADALALQITSILLRQGIKLSEVTDIVAAGGDLGALPDGTYVLNEQIRDESLKRQRNSSLNKGALVAWELREILNQQGTSGKIQMSLCSPLSFATLDPHEVRSAWRVEGPELTPAMKGFVKATPLKSVAAVIAEIEKISPDRLNLLTMTLDELFASVTRKIGPRIVREMAAQDANNALSRFDFDRIVRALQKEGFTIPPHFGLASGADIGSSVREICELIMIGRSGKIPQELAASLNQVVDTYARRVATILEMASAGTPAERPHFVAITSMMATDPHFQDLFFRIRSRVDMPFTPMMLLDSLEHEYLIAGHFFEMYVNPARGTDRLLFSVEARSMRHALQVLGSPDGRTHAFAFAALLDQVAGSIAEGKRSPGNIVLVGADNEDALEAVASAKEYGIVKKLVLIGDPEEIRSAVERTKIPLSLDSGDDTEVLATDPFATDFEAKKKSMTELLRSFLKDHPGFSVMKGSLPTADLLRAALSIYKPETEQGSASSVGGRRLASCTAIFVLPDGRFFALSDPAVNPGFRDPAALVTVLENQVEIVRKVVEQKITLKVAIITAVEKRTSAIPATQLAAEAVERASELEARYGPMVVEGPLSFDLATVPDVSDEKHYEGQIRGDANCLVATDINTANVIYKMLSKTMGSLGLMVDNAAIITAGRGTTPIVLTSRGDTAQTKFNSILLAFAYACPGEASALSIG